MPKNTNILLIRHGEKPSDQNDTRLNLAGQARAMAYIVYFQNFKIKSQVIKLDYLFATAQSAHSNRPYLTLHPLAQQLNLAINNQFENTDEDVATLTNLIQTDPKYNNANILICWHHQKLIEMASALGATEHSLPINWHEEAFGWLIQLSYDANGKLTQAATVEEKLMYND